MDLDSLFGLTKFESFVLKWDILLEEQFLIEDPMKLIMNSKWMFMEAIGFHKKVIYFEVPKKCPNKEAEQRILQIISKLIVRGKKFFDFIYKLDFRMLVDSEFGVIFRYVDAYNYYAFVINNKKISAVKIKEGEVSELGFIIIEK